MVIPKEKGEHIVSIAHRFFICWFVCLVVFKSFTKIMCSYIVQLDLKTKNKKKTKKKHLKIVKGNKVWSVTKDSPNQQNSSCPHFSCFSLNTDVGAGE